MNTSSQTQTLRSQGSPVLLLAQLLATHPGLPAVTYHIDGIVPTQLDVSVHSGLEPFEAWRQALGLPVPRVHDYQCRMWVAVEGTVADVSVKLAGFGSRANITRYAAACGLPLPGELAEQRHLLDPLDRVLSGLATAGSAVAA